MKVFLYGESLWKWDPIDNEIKIKVVVRLWQAEGGWYLGSVWDCFSKLPVVDKKSEIVIKSNVTKIRNRLVKKIDREHVVTSHKR